jgi:hypothetical protein
MITNQFFSAILALAFLDSLTNALALSEKRNGHDESDGHSH